MQQLTLYWSVITQYLDPVKIILISVLTAIYAIAFVLVAIIFLRKKIVIPKAKNKILYWCSIIYLILLPVFAGVCGAGWGFTHGLQKEILRCLPNYTRYVDVFFNQSIAAQTKKLPPATADEYIEQIAEIIYNEQFTLIEKSKAIGLPARATGALHKMAVKKTLSSYMKKTIRKTLKSKLLLGEDITKELMQTKVNELLNEGLLAKILGVYIKFFLNGIKSQILLIFLAGALAPVIIMQALHYLLKRRALTNVRAKNTPAAS